MIVYSENIELPQPLTSCIKLHQCDNLHKASALVVTPEDAENKRVCDYISRFTIPLFIVFEKPGPQILKALANTPYVSLFKPLTPIDISQIESSARNYDFALLPTFTRTVARFSSQLRPTFACPGHQGGGCLDLSPEGYRFKNLLGEQIFKLDVPHAAPELGDILSHEGPVHNAENLAAEVFGSDETYFVLNGTSTANKIVTSALVAAGDLVLMDRNNHKSIFLGALVLSGGVPIYLDNHRDEFGVLGGYALGALDEVSLRTRAAKVDHIKAQRPRPFRLAIVQHATCDGAVLDARELVRRVGHLCEYILFDSAWLGYEQFITSLKDKSPLTLPLSEKSPGIIVTQSVHKQMSGLSQTSQIHKKDHHVRGQARFCSKEAFNSAFMLHSSTSPSYPLFMSLEVNAAIHANGQGEAMWKSAVSSSSFLNSLVASQCSIIKPYSGGSPLTAHHKNHDDYEHSKKHIPFVNGSGKNNLKVIEDNLHYRDPCKLLFTTKPTIHDAEGHNISIPGPIVTQYLRECNFTPEKSDFYNFTILISPSTNRYQLSDMATKLKRLEQLIENNACASEALPFLCTRTDRYNGISLRELCLSINNLYELHDVERLQHKIFTSHRVSAGSISNYEANQDLIRGNYESVSLEQAIDRTAVEGLIPYPPGIMCVAPGEKFTQDVIRYLLAVEDLTVKYPEFSPHIQGVHTDDNSSSMVILVAT